MKKYSVLMTILIFVIICIVVGLLNWWQKVTYEKRLIATVQRIIMNTGSSSEIIEDISATWRYAISTGVDFNPAIINLLLTQKSSLENLEKINNKIAEEMLYLRRYSSKNKEAYSAVADLYVNYSQIYSIVQAPRGSLISFNEEVNKLSFEYLKLLTKVQLSIPQLGEAVVKATAERISLREKKVEQAQEEAKKARKAQQEAKEAERKAQQEAKEAERKAQQEAKEAEVRRKAMLRDMLLQAKKLYESGKEKEAFDIYISVLSPDASLPKNIYLYLGKEYSSSNNYKESIAAYNKALDLNKEDLIAYYEIAKIYVDLKQYENAIGFLKKALEIDSSLDTIDRIAILYIKMNKYDDAIITYRQVIKELPVKYYDKIVDVNISQERYNSAILVYEEAIKALPKNLTFLEKLGLLYTSLNRYEEAITIFKKALERADFKGSKPFHNYIGNCYYFLKQYDKAIGEYREALYLNKSNGEYNFNLGRVLVDNGSFVDGRSHLEIAKGLGKADAELYYYLGRAYKSCGYLDKAKESFEEAIKLCNDEKLKEGIGRALKELNKKGGS